MFEELKSYASKFNVPIIRDEGLFFLIDNIKKYNVKDILEVGTAIGYSSLNMASLNTNVITLERNKEMYDEAIKNISKYDFGKNIRVVFTDALEYTPDKEFDLIFIDAAKAQNIKFFLRFTPYLRKGGIVIVDNLNFHGLTDNITADLSRNLRSMLKKINMFKEWLKENKEYDTLFTNLGDGMSVSVKK